MATIDSKEIIQAIIDGNGVYPGDDPRNPVVKIVRYVNRWGGTAHGVVYAHESPHQQARYDREISGVIGSPEIIWELKEE